MPESGEIHNRPCKHCGTILEHVWTMFEKPQWVALGAHAITDCLRTLLHRAETAEMMLLNEVNNHKRDMEQINKKLEALGACF